jgi:hypothetical protein
MMTTTDTPTPLSLAVRALELPVLIEQAEDELLAEEECLARCKQELEDLEAYWLTVPESPIDGKTEAVRKAQLLTRTRPKVGEVTMAEQARNRARVRLHRLENERKSIAVVAQLLGRESE